MRRAASPIAIHRFYEKGNALGLECFEGFVNILDEDVEQSDGALTARRSQLFSGNMSVADPTVTRRNTSSPNKMPADVSSSNPSVNPSMST